MKDACSITVILDRSGSMTSVKEDVVSGLNNLLDEQRKVDKECKFTLVQFDSTDPFEILRDNVDIHSAENIKLSEYVPRDMTPLYDAVGRGINHTGRQLSQISENKRPNKVLFVIVTDGLENYSREFNRDKVMEMVKHQREKYNWEFVFIGASEESMKQGADMGIPTSSSVQYNSSKVGTQAMMSNLSGKFAKYRKGDALNMDYSDEEREELKNSK